MIRSFSRWLAVAAASATFSMVAQAAPGDSFPDKPITVIVPFGPGAATDVNSRRMFQHISATTGWQFVVENRPGGSSIIGAEAALRAAPDGYTIFMGSTTSHAANPNLFKKLPYDPINDFIPISRTEVIPQVAFAAPKHNIKSIKELVELLQKNPGTLSFGTGSETARAASESFLARANVTAIRVPFNSSAIALTNLIGGHVDFMFTDTSAAMTLIKGGQLQPLALVSPKRLDVLPGVPTMNEVGYPGFQVVSWAMVFALKGTPPQIVEKLSKVVASYTGSASARDYFAERGGYIDVLTSEQSTAWIKSEIGRYKAFYEQMGITPQ